MNYSHLIQDLRALTQAGMKDCKDALVEAAGDLDKAVDIIKKKGLNIVSAREGKIAAEGIVVISSLLVDASKPNDGSYTSAMVEVNCQTDFVANGQDFTTLAGKIAAILLHNTLNGEVFDVQSVEQDRQDLVTKTKENVVVRRWWVEQVFNSNAKVFTYTHSNNKIGVLLTLLAPTKLAKDSFEFNELGNDLAMQIAAMNPLAISSDKLDPAVVERQRAIFQAQLKELNKPEKTWDKILEGKFNKWHTEVCLLEQESVVTPKTTVKQVLKNIPARLGGEIQVVNFIRCQVGEGIEVKKTNFTDEVSQLSGVPQTVSGSCILRS